MTCEYVEWICKGDSLCRLDDGACVVQLYIFRTLGSRLGRRPGKARHFPFLQHSLSPLLRLRQWLSHRLTQTWISPVVTQNRLTCVARPPAIASSSTCPLQLVLSNVPSDIPSTPAHPLLSLIRNAYSTIFHILRSSREQSVTYSKATTSPQDHYFSPHSPPPPPSPCPPTTPTRPSWIKLMPTSTPAAPRNPPPPLPAPRPYIPLSRCLHR